MAKKANDKINWLKGQAEAGKAESQYQLGRAYDYGRTGNGSIGRDAAESGANLRRGGGQYDQGIDVHPGAGAHRVHGHPGGLHRAIRDIAHLEHE